MMGFRGFPDVQGGVEKHAEELSRRLAKLGCEVEAIVRSPYIPADAPSVWEGIRFTRVFAPRSRSFEALVHSLAALLIVARRRPDVLHIQGIGPSLVTPIARLLGVVVVCTNHGPDYERQKWGRLARFALRSGERLSALCAHGVIAISRTIAEMLARKYGIRSILIPNGVSLPQLASSTSSLDQFALLKGKYVLLVGRLVPEKRHLDLIEAFRLSNLDGWKLVIVGAADHPDPYSLQVQQRAAECGVVMTGFQRGTSLAELYTHAGLFVLPSTHEGLPIALLEALSYGLPVLASDIPPHLEIDLPNGSYFPVGDRQALAARLRLAVNSPSTSTPEDRRSWVVSRYSWDAIALKTRDTYLQLLGCS